MKNDELLDLVNEKDEIIETVWKSEAHKNPKLIHREVAIIIFNSDKEVLLQKRSLKKIHEPGAWRITAGHVGAGENPLEAAKREVFEELGLKIEPTFFNKRFSTFENKESRFFWTYYSVVNKNENLRLNIKEVDEVRWLSVKNLEKFSKTHEYSLQRPSHVITMEIYNYLFKHGKLRE